MKSLTNLVIIFASTLFGVTALAAQSAPSNWPNSYTASNGTIWSDVLSGNYVNCISNKDSNGNPIADSDGDIVCKTDTKGGYLGTSANELEILDSDAIEACKAIGGELPSFEQLWAMVTSAESDNLGHWISITWTTRTASTSDSDEASTLSAGDGGSGFQPRNLPMDVRCVSHN
jgi:hypothetical protein